MFAQILFTQWKWIRPFLLFAVLVAFAVPVLSVGRFGPGVGQVSWWEAAALLRSMQSWSIAYTLLAAWTGLMLGMSAWSADRRGRHVYALSLPIERWRYVLLRFGAGVVLLLAPALTLAIGAVLATSTVTIPAGLQAYPLALAARFTLAALVAFALFYLLSSLGTRTAAWVLIVLGSLVAADVFAGLAHVHLHLVERLVYALDTWPGVFDVFTGRWMLIDV